MNERLLYASSFEFGDSASRTLPQHQKPPMWLQHEQQPPMRCAQCDTARARIDALEHELSSMGCPAHGPFLFFVSMFFHFLYFCFLFVPPYSISSLIQCSS